MIFINPIPKKLNVITYYINSNYTCWYRSMTKEIFFSQYVSFHNFYGYLNFYKRTNYVEKVFYAFYAFPY